MTTLTHPAPTRSLRGSRPLAGTGVLLRLALRRDRVIIPIWVCGLGFVIASSPSSLKELYSTQAERSELATSMSTNSAFRALYGPIFSDSIGGLTAWRMLGFGAVLAAIMSLIVVVRHTREEEESGRQELLSAAMVGRRAPLTAALLTAFLANLGLALIIASGLVAGGLPATGAMAFGAGIGGIGVLFAAIAAVAAQLTEGARLAKGLTAAVLGVSFVLRAAGDAAISNGEATLTWLSPLGWAQNLRAFSGERWWALGLIFVAAFVAGTIAFVLAGRRDIGASFLPVRPGPAHASANLGTPLGLAWRLQRGNLLGWAVGLGIAAAVYGGITSSVSDLVNDNENMREVLARLGGEQGIADAFLASMVQMIGMVAAVYAVGSVLRLVGEENSQRAEPILANVVGRLRWGVSHLVMAFGGAVVVMGASGLTMGFAYGVTTDNMGSALLKVLGACLVQVAAIWVLASIAVLLFGVVPRAASAVWGILGICLAIGWIGPVVKAPQWVMDVTPFGHLAKVPGAAMAWAPIAWLVVITVVLTAIGLFGLRRRDIG